MCYIGTHHSSTQPPCNPTSGCSTEPQKGPTHDDVPFYARCCLRAHAVDPKDAARANTHTCCFFVSPKAVNVSAVPPETHRPNTGAIWDSARQAPYWKARWSIDLSCAVAAAQCVNAGLGARIALSMLCPGGVMRCYSIVVGLTPPEHQGRQACALRTDLHNGAMSLGRHCIRGSVVLAAFPLASYEPHLTRNTPRSKC